MLPYTTLPTQSPPLRRSAGPYRREAPGSDRTCPLDAAMSMTEPAGVKIAASWRGRRNHERDRIRGRREDPGQGCRGWPSRRAYPHPVARVRRRCMSVRPASVSGRRVLGSVERGGPVVTLRHRRHEPRSPSCGTLRPGPPVTRDRCPEAACARECKGPPTSRRRRDVGWDDRAGRCAGEGTEARPVRGPNSQNLCVEGRQASTWPVDVGISRITSAILP